MKDITASKERYIARLEELRKLSVMPNVKLNLEYKPDFLGSFLQFLNENDVGFNYIKMSLPCGIYRSVTYYAETRRLQQTSIKGKEEELYYDQTDAFLQIIENVYNDMLMFEQMGKDPKGIILFIYDIHNTFSTLPESTTPYILPVYKFSKLYF